MTGVRFPRPKLPTKSRNVKRYVLARLRTAALERASAEARADQAVAFGNLNGRMRTEADRVLRELDLYVPAPKGEKPTAPKPPKAPRADTPATVAAKARTVRAVGKALTEIMRGGTP